MRLKIGAASARCGSICNVTNAVKEPWELLDMLDTRLELIDMPDSFIQCSQGRGTDWRGRHLSCFGSGGAWGRAMGHGAGDSTETG